LDLNSEGIKEQLRATLVKWTSFLPF
jgi:hypothetical protein